MGFGAEPDVDYGVNYYGAEHGDEDPEVVEPETFGGVGVVYPAL